MIIESPQNQHVKRLRALETRKGRHTHRQFLVEGVRALEESIGGRLNVDTLAICPTLIKSERAEELVRELAQVATEVLQMSEEAFCSFSQVQSPEGLAAAVGIPSLRIEDLSTDADLIVAAVDLRDPGNMGTLVRTADAAGAQALIATGTCVDVFDPKVARATAGSVFHLPIVNDVPPMRLIDWARTGGIQTIAGHLAGAKPHTSIRYPKKVMVLVGNEANGLSEDVVKNADHRAYIPMPGRAESLNVTVAAAILIWEILRQRHT